MKADIFGTYINGKAMRQSQIKLDKDVNLQSEMIEYIMSKCLDNFERSLILIDCAQVNLSSNLAQLKTFLFQFIDSMSWKVLNHFANDHRASRGSCRGANLRGMGGTRSRQQLDTNWSNTHRMVEQHLKIL